MNSESVPPRSSITWRSVLLGLIGAVAICALTPYNDYALNNAAMVGNNLPIGAMLYMFVIAIAINAPLSRFAPRLAMGTGELVVAFSMTLVACALPSAGLMRYLPPMLVAPFGFSSVAEYRDVMSRLDLPKWLFPQMSEPDLAMSAGDPVISGFVSRWIGPGGIPYAAWTVPIICWGIFIFALYGALLCIVTLVRRQWFENERLAFPLVEIELALVEAPKPGKLFNSVLSRRAFWVAFGVIFVIHLFNGGANYWPQTVPRLPLSYDISSMTASSPWSFMRWAARASTIYFTVVGATYFVPANIAFSLWFFFILEQVYFMAYGGLTGDGAQGTGDQHLGAIFAFALAFLWLGRAHWMLILRQAFRGRRPGEPSEPYLPYPLAFWGLVACTIVMVGWLVAAGSTVGTAVVAVLVLLLLFTVITRIVAETGLIHGMLMAHLHRLWDLPVLAGLGKLVPLRSYFVTSMADAALYDYREVASVYASHAMKMADATDSAPRPGAWKFVALLALALGVGYVVSFYSTLHTEYSHQVSLNTPPVDPINPWGTTMSPRWWLLDPAVRYQNDRVVASNNVFGHITAGFGITAALSWARVTFTWWPLHPIGYLMLGTFPGYTLWFSIFLGWLAKKFVVTLGGPKYYVQAKPFFLGLVVGESVAAGFWMLIGLILSSIGADYRPLIIMPA